MARTLGNTAKPREKPRPVLEPLVPQPHGGALRPGGDKRSGGRPPDAWRAELQRLVSSDQVLDALERVLSDPGHPAYIGALKYASDHGYGRARETVELTGAQGGPVVVEYRHESKKRTAS